MVLGRALFIVNPAAKHGETAKLVPSVERLAASAATSIQIAHSAGPRHAFDLASAAEGFDAVVAVGGDGTAHEVLNGVMKHSPQTRPLYGIVPTGSGNDYAHTLGISDDVATAFSQLAAGHTRRVDLGRCNGIWFGESVAVGLDARVTAKAVELKSTTRLSGLSLYLRALLYVLRHQYYGHRVVIGYDDEPPFETEMLIVAATNGPTYGGGFRITPDSILDDGLLDVCRIDMIPKLEAFVRLPFVILGKHTKMRPVHMARARRVTIVAEKPFEGQIDGEVLFESAYDIEVVPAALDVLVPGDASDTRAEDGQ